MERLLTGQGRQRQREMIRGRNVPAITPIEKLSYRTDIALAAVHSLLSEGNEQRIPAQRDELLELINKELADEPDANAIPVDRLLEMIRVIVADVLEEMLDPDEGLEIAPEVRERLMRSLDTPTDELLTPEQMMRRSQV